MITITDLGMDLAHRIVDRDRVIIMTDQVIQDRADPMITTV